MKRYTIFTIVTVLLIVPTLRAEQEEARFSVVFSLYYLDGAGNPDEDYLGFAEAKDYESLVPRLGVAMNVGERLQIGASYTDFGTLEAEMYSPQWPPFEGIGMDVISRFQVEEKMDSYGLGISYRSRFGPGEFRVGGRAYQESTLRSDWKS